MKYSIADISTDLLLAAAFTTPKNETSEEAEFRRVFGRDPEECDRKLGLARVLSTASLVMVSEVQS